MADPVTALPEESGELPLELPAPALQLLRRRDFRTSFLAISTFLAISASELGDSLHYIAPMWVALQTGGPRGVIAVRLAEQRALAPVRSPRRARRRPPRSPVDDGRRRPRLCG